MSQRVLVTGAGGALGKSAVSRFLAAGQSVLAAARTPASLARLAGLGPAEKLALHGADLTSTAEVARLFDLLEKEAGDDPPVVVHLAGGFRYALLRDLSDEDWSYLRDVNLETTFRICREFARRLPAARKPTGSDRSTARGGALVAVASPAALLGEAGVAAYAAAKAGVLRLIESLAREVAPFGGRANAVLPGTMDTPANRAAMPDADPDQWVPTEAVAEVIYYLTTPASAAVNGAAVRVPGPSL